MRVSVDRKRFMTSLKKRFSLRLHMTMILMATSLAGVLASKGMLAVGLHNVALRYPITVLFAYLVFFATIKIWLWLSPVRNDIVEGLWTALLALSVL
jgi:hypothetical protein